MDLSKSYEVFNPARVKDRIHIIGCGSVGSTVAELLARFGLTKFTLYDFDYVEPHNLANQMFIKKHIGKLKVEALKEMICDINPEAEPDIKLQPQGWNGQPLTGIVILAVDNIEVRKEIVKANKGNAMVKAMFDFRTGLFDAQHYAADWSKKKYVDDFFNSMDFSHEEAAADTPVSACGVTLGVAPTVRLICTLGVSNIANFLLGKQMRKVILADAFGFHTNDSPVLAMG